MSETYILSLSYAPMMLFSIIGAILFHMKKLTFNKSMALVAIAFLVKLAFHVAFGGILPFLAQTLIALVLFVILISLLSGRASGETLLTMSALFLLTPLVHGVLAFVAAFVVLFLYSIFVMRKNMNEWKDFVFLAFLSTGFASMMPNYEHLPERKSLDKDAKRFSMLPIIAIVYSSFAIYYALRPMWLEF